MRKLALILSAFGLLAFSGVMAHAQEPTTEKTEKTEKTNDGKKMKKTKKTKKEGAEGGTEKSETKTETK